MKQIRCGTSLVGGVFTTNPISLVDRALLGYLFLSELLFDNGCVSRNWPYHLSCRICSLRLL